MQISNAFFTSYFRSLSNMVEYDVGTCYGCRKCMYCGIYNLNTNECNCDKTVKPNKNNRTQSVPHTYSRISEKDTTPRKKSFIQQKNTLYSYNFDLEKRFLFTLCSSCNSNFQRLSEKKSKSISVPENSNNSSFYNKESSAIDP